MFSAASSQRGADSGTADMSVLPRGYCTGLTARLNLCLLPPTWRATGLVPVVLGVHHWERPRGSPMRTRMLFATPAHSPEDSSRPVIAWDESPCPLCSGRNCTPLIEGQDH